MPLNFLISITLIATCTHVTTADSRNALIETSILVNVDTINDISKRRYSTLYNPLDDTTSIEVPLNSFASQNNTELLTSLDLVYQSFGDEDLFDAFDHTLSYSIDLVNGDLFGPAPQCYDKLKQILFDAIKSTLKRSDSLEIDLNYCLENITSRLIGNLIINKKSVVNWNESTPDWLNQLSQVFLASLIDYQRSSNSQSNLNGALDSQLILSGCKNFFDATLNLYSLEPDDDYRQSHLYSGITPILQNEKNELMMYEGEVDGYFKFDPQKSLIIASTADGLLQKVVELTISESTLETNNYESLLSGAIQVIDQSFYQFIGEYNGDNSQFINELTKSIALGVSSGAVKAANQYINLSETLTVEQLIEMTSMNLGKYAVSESLNIPNLSIKNISESVSVGIALGTQQTYVSLNQNSLQDSSVTRNRSLLAKFSSRGAANGTIDSVSSNIEQILDNTFEADRFVSEVASSSAKGSVFGNSVIGLYNPSSRGLLSILRSSAEGAAEGATSAPNLDNIDKSQNETEGPIVQVARGSAQGAALGATFGITVLDNAKPDTLFFDEKSISVVESTALGSAYGSIAGSIKNGAPDQIVVKQASKQGSTEGALIGAGLGTSHNEEFFNTAGNFYIDSELNSKKNLIIAISKSTDAAAKSLNSNRARKVIRTKTNDFNLLLERMRINLKTSNPTGVFKEKRKDELDSDFPIKNQFRAASPI